MFRELTSRGIAVPDGFATTTEGYWSHLEHKGLKDRVTHLIRELDPNDVADLKRVSKEIRSSIVAEELPAELSTQIAQAYSDLCSQYGPELEVAVRSSATSEDLPTASFAGQQETYLNISGEKSLIDACKRCFASLFTERAISYRAQRGINHMQVGISVGIQKMVRSDLACSGVLFTLDPDTGFADLVLVTSVYGLGEPLVQGRVTPDEFLIFKPTLRQGFRAIITRRIGSKKIKMISSPQIGGATQTVAVSESAQSKLSLTDDEALTLAEWGCIIEEHYSALHERKTPMDIEWAKDGVDGKLYVVQARPETVVSQRTPNLFKSYQLKEKGKQIVSGRAVGQRIGQGQARILSDISEMEQFQANEVLVTTHTDPDWEPLMKVARAIVTDSGGRTSHAAIVSRELGIPCIVGATGATQKIQTGQEITVSCAEGDAGIVYEGLLPFEKSELDAQEIPKTITKIALNIGEPEQAYALSFLPNDGVGLARIEFIINSIIRIHPRALLDFDHLTDTQLKRQIADLTSAYPDKGEYFTTKLSEGVAQIASAFYPKPVIVRMSDFKSNEYAKLIGGELFEPKEENPMIGWRGASRYYHREYQACFALECEAMRRVFHVFGLKNLILMIPFCRDTTEAQKVVALMGEFGIDRREIPLYAMCEIPSNIILAADFLDIFDGFSIGTNDLTQLVLGVDRDSSVIADLFNEQNQAVKQVVQEVIEVARKKGKYIGICGDAPSTYPEFAQFLVECGIGAISVSPDVAATTRIAVAQYEAALDARRRS